MKHSSPTQRRRSMHRQDGQALVETALVIPVLLLIVFGALQLGHAFHVWQQVSAAASEGARRAIVSASAANPEEIVASAVVDAAPNLDSSDLSVNVSSTWRPGDPATVTVGYPMAVAVLGRTLYNGTITSSRTMMVSN